MTPRPGRAQPASSLLVAAGVVLLTVLSGPSLGTATAAAQAQSRESPRPRSNATPRSTQTPAVDQTELQQRKLIREIRLLDGQIDRPGERRRRRLHRLAQRWSVWVCCISWLERSPAACLLGRPQGNRWTTRTKRIR